MKIKKTIVILSLFAIYLVISLAPVHAAQIDQEQDQSGEDKQTRSSGLEMITGAQSALQSGLLAGGAITGSLLLLLSLYLFYTYMKLGENEVWKDACIAASGVLAFESCMPWYIIGGLLLVVTIVLLVLAFTIAADPEEEESDQFEDTQKDGSGAKENIPNLQDDIRTEIKDNEDNQQSCTQADADRSYLKGERQQTESQYRYLVTYRVSGCSDQSTFSLSFQGDKTQNIKSGTVSKGQIAEETLTIESTTLYQQACLKIDGGRKCVDVS